MDLLIIIYLAGSFAVVFLAMVKYPPRSHARDAGEWLIALAFCWLIWPFAVLDLVHPRKLKP